MHRRIVPRNFFGKPVGKIRLSISRCTSEGIIKMDLKIDGMSGLVAWIFLAQGRKELGDFVNKLLKYSQNLSYSQTFGFRTKNSGNLLHS